MRRPRSQLSIRLYREYSPPRLPPDKAPTLLSANDKDKPFFLLELAPGPDQTDVASANRAIPDLGLARLKCPSRPDQTFPTAIAACALQCLSTSLFAYDFRPRISPVMARSHFANKSERYIFDRILLPALPQA